MKQWLSFRRVGIAMLLCLLPASGLQASRVDQSYYDTVINQALNSDSTYQADQQQLEAKAEEIRVVEERIDTLEDQISELAEQQLTLKNHLDLIDDNVELTQKQIDRSNVEIEHLQIEMRVIENKITQTQKTLKHKRSTLESIVQDMYMEERLTPLEALFDNQTLADYTANLTYTASSQTGVRDLVQGLEQDQLTLENALAEQRQKKVELAKKQAQLKTAEGVLLNEKEYKQELLAETKNSEEKFQALLADAQIDRERVQQEIDRLSLDSQQRLAIVRRQVLAKLADDPNAILTPEEQLSITGDVQFIWPATGMITCGFHCSGYLFESSIGPHTGTDIGVPFGTPVKAAAAGKVERVAYPVSTDLAFIQISHNAELSSLYLHLSEVDVEPGEFVQQGQVIGYSGGGIGQLGAGWSSGPHLHFEIRKDGYPVDAQGYLPQTML